MTGFDGRMAFHPKIKEFTFRFIELRMTIHVEKAYCEEFELNWDQLRRFDFVGMLGMKESGGERRWRERRKRERRRREKRGVELSREITYFSFFFFFY